MVNAAGVYPQTRNRTLDRSLDAQILRERGDNMRGECIDRLLRLGIDYDDALALRRIAMTLHLWHERECGTGSGCIERDETTGKAYWLNSNNMHRSPIADREKGARKRLAKLMAKYPTLTAYIQSDPRGAALYILRPEDMIPGHSVDSYYSRGVAVYQ